MLRKEVSTRLLKKFKSLVYATDECIAFPSLTNKGYGMQGYTVAGKHKNISAHRLSFIIFKGDIIEAKQVCHTCDNPACINPKHLFLGSKQDNVDDCVNKGRFSAHKVMRSNSKISEVQRDLIKKSYSKGIVGRGYISLGKQFGISPYSIKHIVNNT